VSSSYCLYCGKKFAYDLYEIFERGAFVEKIDCEGTEFDKMNFLEFPLHESVEPSDNECLVICVEPLLTPGKLQRRQS